MLKTEKDKAICEKYSALDETGHVHCHECPLVVSKPDMMCKANAHYDRHQAEWVPDDAEEEERSTVIVNHVYARMRIHTGGNLSKKFGGPCMNTQCVEIEEELDKLTEWETEFYLYCLLPKFADRLEATMKDIRLVTSVDYMAKEQLRQNVRMLRMVREAMVYDLF